MEQQQREQQQPSEREQAPKKLGSRTCVGLLQSSQLEALAQRQLEALAQRQQEGEDFADRCTQLLGDYWPVLEDFLGRVPRVLMQDPDGCRLVEVLRQTVAAGPRALVQAVMPDPKSCHEMAIDSHAVLYRPPHDPLSATVSHLLERSAIVEDPDRLGGAQLTVPAGLPPVSSTLL